MFPKTGIKHTRLDAQKREVELERSIRRIAPINRTGTAQEQIEGQQNLTEYILYSETGDDYQVDDLVYIPKFGLFENGEFKDSFGIIKLRVRETPKKYGTLKLGNRQSEVYLTTLN
jgi:hypothetical protein